MIRRLVRALPLALAMCLLAPKAFAQDAGPSPVEISYALDNMMLFICAVLVFFMQAGFALVEVGFNSAKNALEVV